MRSLKSLGLLALLAGLLMVGPSPSGSARADVETMMGIGVDIPGGDYSSFALNIPDPGICRQACDQNYQCQGWTFVKPGVQAATAMCWLKSTLGGSVQNQNTISGTKPGGGGPPPGAARVENDMMLGVDLAGGDIASFTLAAGNPELCRQACNGRADCQAWTFVKPGVQGPLATCWLKGSVPGGRFNNGVISGLRGQGGGGSGGGAGGGMSGGGPGAGDWGVWAYRAYGSNWGDACSIQYVASPVGNARYVGNPSYVLVRVRPSQRDADLDIHEFSLFHKNQPDGVVKMIPCPSGTGGQGGGGGGQGGGGGGGGGGQGGGDYREWMTGTFDTGGGVMQLSPAGGTYQASNGRMTVTSITGNVMEGIWTQSSSGGQCPDGQHRGRFRLEFTEGGFTGVFGYCEEEPHRRGGFQGTRRR